MYQISTNNIISLSRGDSFIVPLFINQGSKAYPIRYDLKYHKEFELYFGVMECNQKFEDAVIRKRWTYDTALINQFGDLMIELKPEDTLLLHPGKYFYQVKMKHQTKDGETVSSVTPTTEFWILD